MLPPRHTVVGSLRNEGGFAVLLESALSRSCFLLEEDANAPARSIAAGSRHAAMDFDKTRIRFRKDGDLRLVSHHDLMRAFERMLRRAALPFRTTEGFHPQPRLVFALSLPLGVVGQAEVVEIEWTEPVDPEHARSLLNDTAPAGLTLLSASRIELKQSAHPRRAIYRLAIPAPEASDLARRCSAAIASTDLWVDRERPRPRQVNIRPYVKNLQCAPEPEAAAGDAFLEMEIWVTPEGSARADELVRLLELNHLIDRGAVLERTTLELWDEIDPSTAESIPDLGCKKNHALFERPAIVKQPETIAASAHWGASPNGPIIE